MEEEDPLEVGVLVVEIAVAADLEEEEDVMAAEGTFFMYAKKTAADNRVYLKFVAFQFHIQSQKGWRSRIFSWTRWWWT